MKPFSIERPLTLLPIGHNLAVNGSELSEKMAVRMEGAWRVHGVHAKDWLISQQWLHHI